MKMDSTNYKFRAECIADAYNVINKLGKLSHEALQEVKIIPIFMDGLRLPDCEVELKTSLHFIALLTQLRDIPDGHVMLESVQPIEKYTGERIYSRSES